MITHASNFQIPLAIVRTLFQATVLFIVKIITQYASQKASFAVLVALNVLMIMNALDIMAAIANAY